MIEWVCIAFYIGTCAAWHLLASLPFPSVAELFKSLVVFLALYPVRNYMERRWLRRRFNYRKNIKAPSGGEHQAAASAIGDILSH